MTDLKIVTNLAWPSFRNVASDIHDALKPYRHSCVLDWRDAKPGGDILFIETVRSDTLELLEKLLPGSNIVFYGTTEGHSLLDRSNIRLARDVNVVAVSNFVKAMLEEVDVPVAGVVHHGLDMDATEVDTSFLESLEERFKEKLIALTIASNDPRKGLENLLQAYKLVEERTPNSYLTLHSQPKRYYDYKEKRQHERHYNLSGIATHLGLERIWLTDSHGLMTVEEINALYRICHIYVLSSFTEGFGLPILEAFRFNKPVVAVDAPPFNEIIEDGCTGKLVPFKEVRWFNYKDKVLFKMHIYEPHDLAEAMFDLMSDSSIREKMENKIRERKHRWSIHRLYPQLLNYF
jgi:glycosyltransferase involved in cell wall biosynthesis